MNVHELGERNELSSHMLSVKGRARARDTTRNLLVTTW